MFNTLHSILNQELFEKYLCNSRIPKYRNGAVCPSYINYIRGARSSLRCPIAEAPIAVQVAEAHM